MVSLHSRVVYGDDVPHDAHESFVFGLLEYDFAREAREQYWARMEREARDRAPPRVGAPPIVNIVNQVAHDIFEFRPTAWYMRVLVWTGLSIATVVVLTFQAVKWTIQFLVVALVVLTFLAVLGISALCGFSLSLILAVRRLLDLNYTLCQYKPPNFIFSLLRANALFWKGHICEYALEICCVPFPDAFRELESAAKHAYTEMVVTCLPEHFVAGAVEQVWREEMVREYTGQIQFPSFFGPWPSDIVQINHLVLPRPAHPQEANAN